MRKIHFAIIMLIISFLMMLVWNIYSFGILEGIGITILMWIILMGTLSLLKKIESKLKD